MTLSQYFSQARHGDVQTNLLRGKEKKLVSESFWVDISWQEQEYWDGEYQEYRYETVLVKDGYWIQEKF